MQKLPKNLGSVKIVQLSVLLLIVGHIPQWGKYVKGWNMNSPAELVQQI